MWEKCELIPNKLMLFIFVCVLFCSHLFYSRHKLFGNIWPKCFIWKLQLSVVLWLQRLQDTYHFSKLACTTRLLFMCKLKPKRDLGEKKINIAFELPYVLTKLNHSYRFKWKTTFHYFYFFLWIWWPCYKILL